MATRVIGPLLHGSANQKPTVYSPVSMRFALEHAVHRSAPRETRNARIYPVEKSQCEWTMLRPSNSRIQMRSPSFCRGSTPRHRELPTIFKPSKQTNRIFLSKGTNPTSPVQPMALVRAPNSLWRKSLPLTFTLCSPTQFSIVLPEWLLGFREKKGCVILFSARPKVSTISVAPQSPRILSSFFPSHTGRLGIAVAI
jgi:hypothetical protein